MSKIHMKDWYMVVAIYNSLGNFGPYGDLYNFDDAILVTPDDPQLIADCIGSEYCINKDKREVVAIFDDIEPALRLVRLFHKYGFHDGNPVMKGHFEREVWREYNFNPADNYIYTG